MDLNLTGKRAMVCGSTQGIGKATAIELALLGVQITLVARDEEKLKLVCNQLPVAHRQIHDYIVADFNFPDVLGNKVAEYAKKRNVHILVNNTGGPAPGPAIEADTAEFVK
ncbi:MAG TPA: SDR family NAD(P)-dependent oxidoreductase, partial [Chitinophagaceae bacterium]|nr:SDR family NAD(P)-dependent oxidoreductase [Chitinophagaceae bacterium]